MKVHVLTLGYDTTERIMRTVERFFKETDYSGLDLVYYVIDARYPYPNSGANTLNLCQSLFQGIVLDRYPMPISLVILARNFGQSGNYNALRDKFEFSDDDVIVFYDTDVRPSKPSWLKDKCKVLQSPKTAFVTMNCSVTDNSLKNQGAFVTVNDVPCRIVCWPGGWPSGAWKGSFFRHGVTVTHEFYGGTEGNIMMAWRGMNMEGYMMCEHDDIRDLEGMDRYYIEWKASVIAIAGKQIPFEDWLQSRGLIL